MDEKVLTLAQKMVKLREAIGTIQKKKHSDQVKYKFARLADINEFLTPAMNEVGVNFSIVDERQTREAEIGDSVFWTSYTVQTKNGQRTVYVYEATLEIQWQNADDKDDVERSFIHVVGTNDGGPDKAKGAAWTYGIKYYMFNKFNIPMEEDEDPDRNDYSGSYQRNPPRKQQSRIIKPTQVEEICKMAVEDAGVNAEKFLPWVAKAFKKPLDKMNDDEAADVVAWINVQAEKRKAKNE